MNSTERMRDSIRTLDTIAPITGIAFDDDHKVLYSGAGGQIIAYANIGVIDTNADLAQVGPVDLFSIDTIHGIKPLKHSLPRVAVFGGKAVSIVTLLLEIGHEQSIDSSRLIVDMIKENLDDLVLDCTVIDDKLFIGYAHNFVDVLVENKSPTRFERSCRVQCPSISALFSLSIVGGNDNGEAKYPLKVLVASGTAFGKIILWNFHIPAVESLVESTVPSVSIVDVLSNHEGVIFRIQWSKMRNRIASVSDDRTVRVWDLTDCGKGIQVFIGWGHISRLWDVVFVGHSEDKVATSSEDGTIKLWDIHSNTCVATLRGHSSDVWCLALVSHTGDTQTLFSGGNDGSVKAWSLEAHGISCPEDPSSTLVTLPIPCASYRVGAPVSVASRRTNGVSAVTLSPSGAWCVVCLCEGGVWVVDVLAALSRNTNTKTNTDASSSNGSQSEVGYETHQQPSSNHTATESSTSKSTTSKSTKESESESERVGWYYLTKLERAVTNADVIFKSQAQGVQDVDVDADFEGDRLGEEKGSQEKGKEFAIIACAHTDGYVSHVDVFLRDGGSTGKGQSGSVEFTTHTHAWRAHDMRTINVWHAEMPCHDLKSLSASNRYLVTSSVKGTCRLWGAGRGQVSDQGPESSPQLLLDCVTGKGQVAACVLLHRDTLIVGDSRGGISIFRLSEERSSEHSAECSDKPLGMIRADVFIPHAHGSELVSCLVGNKYTGGFYSAGHDGCVCDFTLCGDLVSKLKCLPIKSPDRIVVVGKGERASIYVGGYFGCLYLVCDVRRGYEMMRIEGGGWKRPSHAVLHFPGYGQTDMQSETVCNSLPTVVFVCPAPLVNDTVLLLCDSGLNSRIIGPGSGMKIQVPLHLGTTSQGKVSYCAKILMSCSLLQNTTSTSTPTSSCKSSDSDSNGRYRCRIVFTAVGGEDGNLKVFRYTHNSACVESRRSAFLQEVNMPGNVAIKSLTYAASSRKEAGRERGRERERGSGAQAMLNARQNDSEKEESKAMGCARDVDDSGMEGIVVAVGGRLAYSIWSYDLRSHLPLNRTTSPKGSNDHDDVPHSSSVFSYLTSGFISEKAGQDHRILCVQCVLTPRTYGAYHRRGSVCEKEKKDRDGVCSPSGDCDDIGGRGAVKGTGVESSGAEQLADGENVGRHSRVETDVHRQTVGHIPNCVDTAEEYLVAMGDSRGRVTVAMYRHGFDEEASTHDPSETVRYPKRRNRLVVLEELDLNGSGCPVLSCDVITLHSPHSTSQGVSVPSPDGGVSSNSSSSSSSGCCDGSNPKQNEFNVKEVKEMVQTECILFLACFGDTAGDVSVWLLAGSVVPCCADPQGWRILSSSVKLFSYLAHSSGANTLSLIQTNTHDSPPTSTDSPTTPLGGEGENADLGCVWNVMIASGGDDQAISVCSASISIEMPGERKSGTVDSESNDNAREGALPSVAVTVTHSFSRADGCAGSAIKGVKLILNRTTSSSSSLAVASTSTSTSRTHAPSSSSVTDTENADGRRGRGGTAGNDVSIMSVGYDQRLSLWRPLSLSVPPRDSTASSSSACVGERVTSSVMLGVVQQPQCVKDAAADGCKEEEDDDDHDGHSDGDSESETCAPLRKSFCTSSADIMRNRDLMLKWVCGKAVHIGDVCALDVRAVTDISPTVEGTPCTEMIDEMIQLSTRSEDPPLNLVDVVVVGEGFQLLTASWRD